jgi:hypothetical protein
MSDAESTTSSISESDSIYAELEQVLERCEQLYHHIHSTGETLQSLHTRIDSGDTIKITIDGTMRDLEEVLEEIHMSALSAIREDKTNTFGQRLAAVLTMGVIQ